MPRDREEEELTLLGDICQWSRQHLQAACTPLPSTGKERAASVRGSCLQFEQHAQKPQTDKLLKKGTDSFRSSREPRDASAMSEQLCSSHTSTGEGNFFAIFRLE